MSHKTITTNLRDIPEALHQTIKELAEKEKRSWNSQALIMLQAQADTMSANKGTNKL